VLSLLATIRLLYSAWSQVLCEANANSTVISAIQRALQTQGYYSGAIDGALGRQTYAAVERFQTARGLSTGGLTLTTVEALGVDWRSMVTGTSGVTRSGFTSGGTVTGSTTGFTSGTTVTTTTSTSSGGSYTINADATVTDASGVMIGRLDGNGNVVNSAGQIIVRGVQGTSGSFSGGSLGGGSLGGGTLNGGTVTGGTVTGSTTTRSGGGTSSRLLNRAVQGTSGGGSVLGSGSSSSSSTGGISAGDFQVRADGMVISRSTGAVIGRVDASGNILNAAGTVIGRATPQN